MSEIDNPFDGEAARLVREQGMNAQDARDEVILRYLREGDTRALAHWLITRYCPGKEVRLLLSAMLQPEQETADAAQVVMSIDPEEVPFELKAVRRGGGKGRKHKPAADERNQAIKDMYDRLYGARIKEFGPGMSDSVIAEMVAELGPDVSEGMIREAIKKRSPKSGQGKK